jgi:hypothetical protein
MPSLLRKTMPASALLVIVAVLLLLPACSINVKKNDAGEEKNVDIRTPIGGIHVDQRADARDTGLPVYPGARLSREKEEDGNQKNANVSLSAFGFGLRVAAVEYQSEDAPAKVVAYYRDQLKTFGDVLECHTAGHADVAYSNNDSSKSKELTCEQNSGDNIELKVGNRDNQRIVSIETDGKGSKFALVHVQVRGKDTI